jgi:hypothetical protein
MGGIGGHMVQGGIGSDSAMGIGCGITIGGYPTGRGGGIMTPRTGLTGHGQGGTDTVAQMPVVQGDVEQVPVLTAALPLLQEQPLAQQQSLHSQSLFASEPHAALSQQHGASVLQGMTGTGTVTAQPVRCTPEQGETGQAGGGA